jgi:hypothetical protein
MKKLLTLAILATLFSAAGGCRIGECWREAWNSRFHPQQQQTVVVSDPCMMTDPCCSPCGSPCGCTSAPVMTPGPVVVH